MKRNVVLLGTIGVMLCVLGTANSTIWHIHPDSAISSIQAVIDSSSNGDTVLVYPAIYTENINFSGKNIVLGSLFLTTGDTSYISSTIIDGGSWGSVVTFESGEDSTALITGFTIQNGYAWYDGGGIYCYNSNPSLVDVTIRGNAANFCGGGIYNSNSNPTLTNVTISRSTADCGSGIYCYNSNPSLVNVTISRNTANFYGGGIYCSNSDPSLENVTISGNTSYNRGGGIYCFHSSPIFDVIDRCNIFLNFASSGNDLYASSCSTLDVILDTFTVLQPDDYFAYPVDNFTFDILNAKVEQVGQDLYVSPNGSDNNSGLTPDEPLLRVSCALVKIIADSINPHTIHLANGVYSPSKTGEIFPLWCRSYVSFYGEDEVFTILDAEATSRILYCKNDSNFSLENVTIQNSSAYDGGGIYCSNSTPNLANVIISGNNADNFGGGIYSVNSSLVLTNVSIIQNTSGSGGGIYFRDNTKLSQLNNVTISENTAGEGGGGIYCFRSSPSLTNVIINGNTAAYYGGGIYCSYCAPSLTNVTISGNHADHGSGIYCYESSPILANLIISANTADYYGGGIYCYNSNPSLINVTISGNTADVGGGISCYENSSPCLVNCILWNDNPQEIRFSPYSYPNSITISYSDVEGGESGVVTNDNGIINWLEGNINEDPMFVSGPLSDYHLCPFTPSPCIDAGSPDPQYNDPENPLIPGYAMWPALETIRNDMGVYGGPGTDVWTGVEEDYEDFLLNTFFLKQNIPNPFNLQTAIKYTLPYDSRVTLKVYNISGQKINILVDEFQHSGLHEVVWDGKDNSGKTVPCGVYFLKFDAGRHTTSRKLLKLR